MVTIDTIKKNLGCDDIYIQKMLEYADGNEEKLERLYYFKLAERVTRPAILEVK
ncbi:hypothetical protein LDK94_06725 [Staphylococcus arlettae]|uniref:hypothetical protein n=1 Tax=Staphylococcus arlettae TaxID=29378 RepID=UPI001E55DA0A|nr:hypothetical protein [Staphylococcus arlettae]MCD9055028.1 hypothetical protein [Staphylococcus arlettae]